MKTIHEDLNPISWLVGRWTTKDGCGHYPNIPDFKFHDELEFVCIGKQLMSFVATSYKQASGPSDGQPMFNFTSSSCHPETQKPMHQERGFLRIKPGTNTLAFTVSHNFGLTSLEEGVCDVESKEIVLETINVSRISFAKAPYVKKFKRVLKLLSPNTLEVTLFMETNDTPLTEHLKAIYKREDKP